MRTILIDDERLALEVLEQMLSSFKEIQIVGSYTDYKEVLEELDEIKPEIIFLDIEMGEMDGLELANIIVSKLGDIDIIFVTAYSQFAVDAFEINAIDYLLKPVQEKRLEKAINRLIANKKRSEELDSKRLNELKVYSFGVFKVLDRENKTLNWRTQKSKELFAFLWQRKERALSKDLIIESIFSDRALDKATTLLHTTIYQLRKNLEKLGYVNGIIYSEEGYQLNLPLRSDLDHLRILLKKEDIKNEDIEEILKIYKGDFLEENYHWALDSQEFYRQLVLNKLEIFSREEIEKKRISLLLKFTLDKLYELNPFNNSVVQLMINYYGLKKETVGLKIFFKEYKDYLWEEMKLLPSNEIKNTYLKYI